MEEEPKEEVLPLEEWFEKVTGSFPRPCFLLLKLDAEGKVNLLSISVNQELMEMTEQARHNDYMG